MKKQPPKPMRQPTFYEEVCAIDIIDPIIGLWRDRKISAGLDGRFSTPDEINLNRTWTIARLCPERQCGKWLSIYHRFYKILSPPCKDCWKVVIAPQTVAELIEIQKLQTKLGWPAKAGLETRDYTSGLGGYRAFWYCPFAKGLKGGRKHFIRVQKALEKVFGEKAIAWYIEKKKFYLKRGCTELERDFGPSDQWDALPDNPKFHLLESVWENPGELDKEFSPMIYTNYKRWIEFAIAYGDESVRQYIGNRPLGVQSVKYDKSAHAEGDFKPRMVPFNGSMENPAKPVEKENAERQEEKKNLFGFEPPKGEGNSSTE